MECKDCGRYTSNENANFCEYCGNSFRSEFENPNKSNLNENNHNINQYQSRPEPMNEQERQAPISFKNWILTLLLPFIPVVGWLVYLVMLFVWAFDSSTPKSKKNWARASLIMYLIVFVIMIFFISSFIGSVFNGSFSLNEFNQFNQFY